MHRRHLAVKVVGATIGAVVLAFVVCAGLARSVPLPQDEAFALGAHLFVPLWAMLACTLPLLGRRR